MRYMPDSQPNLLALHWIIMVEDIIIFLAYILFICYLLSNCKIRKS